LTLGVTLITYDDFAKLDMRVAKVIEVEKIPGKSKIVKGVIDLGDEKRDVIIGGAEYYQPEELVGKTVIALVNLEPRKIGGIESGAMLLAADLNDKPFWLTVPDDVTLGTTIK
jgi:tRNA-binding protein